MRSSVSRIQRRVITSHCDTPIIHANKLGSIIVNETPALSPVTSPSCYLPTALEISPSAAHSCFKRHYAPPKFPHLLVYKVSRSNFTTALELELNENHVN
jgi:hypothetical protein